MQMAHSPCHLKHDEEAALENALPLLLMMIMMMFMMMSMMMLRRGRRRSKQQGGARGMKPPSLCFGANQLCSPLTPYVLRLCCWPTGTGFTTGRHRWAGAR
jgi:hypothetical protein